MVQSRLDQEVSEDAMNPLRTMFDHHAWATHTLIDFCVTLPPDQLRATVPGTYGPIMPTLVHLVAADQRYLELMTGARAEHPLREGEDPPLGDLDTRFGGHARLWEDLVDKASELDVTIPPRGPWQARPHAEDLLFLQAIHHGNDHRTHICTALGAIGLEPPEIDGWSFWAATHP
jgi:uncharacterized damage-inducible protein DinB